MGVLKKVAVLQQEVPVIFKSTEGFGYNFADLTAIFNILNPYMAKHGLGFTQGTMIHETGGTIVYTKIYDIEKEDEFLYSEMLIPEDISLAKMNKYQVIGSGITYYKRYQISAMLGLITDTDNDAATADNMKAKTQKAKGVTDKVALKNLTQKVADYLVAEVGKGNITKVSDSMKIYADGDIKSIVLDALKSKEDEGVAKAGKKSKGKV